MIAAKDDNAQAEGDHPDSLSVAIGAYGSGEPKSVMIDLNGKLTAQDGSPAPLKTNVTRTTGGVLYTLSWKYDDLPSGPNTVQIVLKDNDTGYLKQEARFELDRVFEK